MGCIWAGSNGEKWSKMAKYSIFGHFTPFVPRNGQPLCPISAFIDKNVITGCCCNDIYNEKITPGYYHSIFLTFAWKLNFWSFLAIFSPFVPTRKRPLYHIYAFIDKSVITGCCCNDTFGNRVTLGYYHPIFPPFAKKFHFLALFDHYSSYVPAYWQFLCSISACIEKKFSPGVVAIVSVRRKQLQAIYTTFSRHLPENFIFFSVIGHFTPFVPTRGQPLHPTSAFIDETVITGCCCNDICK